MMANGGIFLMGTKNGQNTMESLMLFTSKWNFHEFIHFFTEERQAALKGVSF